MRWICKKCRTAGQGPFLPVICIACGESLAANVIRPRRFSPASLKPGTCRECGCTEANACYSEEHGACWWVAPDLCSHCLMKLPAETCERPTDRAALGASP